MPIPSILAAMLTIVGLVVLYAPFLGQDRMLKRARRAKGQASGAMSNAATAFTFVWLTVAGVWLWSAAGFRFLGRPTWLEGILASIGGLALGGMTTLLERSRPDLVHQEAIAMLLPQGRSQRTRLLVLDGPARIIMEEICFRALPLALFTPNAAIVMGLVSAVLFGLVHTFEGLLPATSVGIMGLAAFAALLLTGSIWTAVLLHAGYNAVGFAAVMGSRRTAALP